MAPDGRVALQLLCNLTRIWERLERDNHGRGLLPPVLPLVVYHGKPKWVVTRRFSGLLDASEEMKRELLGFAFGLVDLGEIPGGQLSSEPALMAGLLVLKYCGVEPEGARKRSVAWVLEHLSGMPEWVLRLAIRYMLKRTGHWTTRGWRRCSRPGTARRGRCCRSSRGSCLQKGRREG